MVGKIPQESAHYIVRDKLRELSDSLERSQVAVVTGLHGIGKTQLAAAYARSRVDRANGLVGWVNADTEDALLADLAAIAERVGVADPNGDSAVSARRLRDHLSGRAAAALLVFDNAIDPDRIRPLLPTGGWTRVVITSTDLCFLSLGASADLEVFARAESVRFLREATSSSDEAGAQLLAAELGDLPLALSAAAATITGRRLDYARYRALLRDHPLPKALSRRRGHDHPLPVDRAIMLSLSTVEAPTDDPELDVVVQWLVGVIAMLSPAGVHRTVLPDRDTRLDEAIQRCVDASLLTWSTGGDALSMHRLVGRVVRERAEIRGIGAELVCAAGEVLETRLFGIGQAWPRRAEGSHLVEHIDALWATGLPETADIDTAARLFDLRLWAQRQLIAATDFTRAIAAGKHDIADSTRILGADHPTTLLCRNNLAMTYYSAGRIDAAIDQQRTVLGDGARTLGADHPVVVLTRSDLGTTLSDVGNFGEAIALLEQALADYLRVHGVADVRTLTCRINLARAYESAGRFDDAIAAYHHVLGIRTRTIGADHADTLLSRNNLATAYDSAGRHAEAIPLQEATLADCERVLGTTAPLTLTVRGNLAMAYRSAERFDDAAALLEQTLDCREKLYGADHPTTIACRTNLGLVLQEAGMHEQAIALQTRTLADCERVLGNDHPYTLSCRNNLADTYRRTDRYAQALALHRQTLADRERLFGTTHPKTATSRNNLAATLEAAGSPTEAIPLYERTIADREQALGPDHPDTLSARNNLAHAHHAAGHAEQASTLYERTLADCERALGPDDPITIVVRSNLDGVR
ncbi:tetratricopeptide repeat protein [Nocardia sp. NPDC052566]|uniref:tetratricopeptide repeat protein n=1 Tax=Nocardia sp. NPDC052566 TaxID=3364330 RepID=UPI0037C6A184